MVGLPYLLLPTLLEEEKEGRTKSAPKEKTQEELHSHGA